MLRRLGPTCFYCLNAKFSCPSAALDVDIRRSDVGIESLVAVAHCYPQTLELRGMVCDGDRPYSTHRGVHAVSAGAHDS